MALLFDAGTEKVSCGSATSVDNIQNLTLCAWVWLTSLSGTQRIWQKQVGTGYHYWGFESSNLVLSYDRATTDMVTSAAVANYAYYGTGKWMFCVSVSDPSTNGNNKSYIGDLTHLATEPSAYVLQQAGVDAFNSDEAGTLTLGNKSNNNSQLGGYIAMLAMYNVQLTQQEVWRQQFDIGRPVRSPAENPFFMHLGIHGASGTGTQIDWSGNGNHGTVTAATQIAHVPIPIRKFWVRVPSYTVAAAAGNPWYAYAQQ